MPYVLVSYDLTHPDRNYDRLKEGIERVGKCIRPLESVWIVETNLPPDDVHDALRDHMDSNDRLLVAALTSSWEGTNLLGETKNTLRKWTGR